MQPSLELASQFSPTITAERSSHWGFAAYAAMALIVIVLLTFMLAALEVFLSGGGSLSAVEAAMM
jgi:hypothetical protein